MATEKHQLRMAMAQESDINDVRTMVDILEFIKENDPQSLRDFDEMELSVKERNMLSQIFEDGVIDVSQLVHYLLGLLHGVGRVLMGYEVMKENCTDPTLTYIDFNKGIKEAFLVWNSLEEHLKEGREVCITPDSTIGQLILLSAKTEEGKEEANG